MKILILSTFDRKGGAAEAAFRQTECLRNAGVDVNMLVRTAVSNSPWALQGGKGMVYSLLGKIREWWERFRFIAVARHRRDWFSFSIGDLGLSLTTHPWVSEADILHIHWVEKGFLSIREIAKLSRLGKPVVWTMHDMWTVTGGCHYAGGCTGYQSTCGQCPFLRWPSSYDLSTRILKAKTVHWMNSGIKLVTCSQWLADLSQSSPLGQNLGVLAIHNPVDTDIFCPVTDLQGFLYNRFDHGQREFLFVAMNAADRRKGFEHLTQAIEQLAADIPSTKASRVRLTILGRMDDAHALPFHTEILGFQDQIQDILQAYRSADFFILPSLEDNLPNTVLEAMACGTPVIAYDCGGVPEMVDHGENGFLVPTGDTDALAEALKMAVEMTPEDHARWRLRARERTVERYSYPVIADKHLAHYRQLLSSSE